jgi:phosphonate transport system substrate-binding protein
MYLLSPPRRAFGARLLALALISSASVLLPAAAHAQASQPAQTVLRVSAIPDEAPTELQRKFKPLGAYLEQQTGMKVEFVPVTDYATSVEGLLNKKLDMVWFGGFTFVQAKARNQGKVIPIVQREEDEAFKSVFITTDKSINRLEDLKGKTFAFGSESSTSGHLMPRYFLLAAKINPDTDMKRIAFSGAHDATVAAVAGGKVDAGVLNISVWEKLVSQNKVDRESVRAFYTTPGYFDYNWTVRSDMDPALRKKLTDAFLALNKRDPQGKEILDLQRATRFIPTRAENYEAIEKAAHNAGLLK